MLGLLGTGRLTVKSWSASVAMDETTEKQKKKNTYDGHLVPGNKRRKRTDEARERREFAVKTQLALWRHVQRSEPLIRVLGQLDIGLSCDKIEEALEYCTEYSRSMLECMEIESSTCPRRGRPESRVPE